MKIKWLGHASFLIESESGTRIITDPYESGGYDGAVGYGPIKERADVVVISHGHADHSYTADIEGSPRVVEGPGIHNASGIEFNGVACFHDGAKGKLRGKNTMFTFDVDGIRICHVGDLGHLPSESQMAALGKVDVLLEPVGGFYTIGAEEATTLAEKLSPSVVIPMHYSTDKCAFPISGVENFLAGKKNARKAGSAEVEIKKESLPSETQIIVLEHAL